VGAARYWWFIGPSVLVIFAIVLFPWVFTIWMSVQEWSPGSPPSYVGMRNYAELIGILERSPAQKSRGETSAPISKSYLMGTVYALMKNEAKAKASFEDARVQAEAAVRESPTDGPRHALLGLIYAGLGRCAHAIREGDRAVELLPETEDAFDGPILAVTRARIAVLCGDHATALALIGRSLSIPAGITVYELERDPTWDPLRSEPRFKQLVATNKPAG